jgi:peptidoglycan/LPS O-acetylase OafA/YrhL
MHHRNDIEGLRGVAVLMVIAYHASSRILPGGYVGVDVFFVISGYLITQLLVHEYGASGDGISVFYERRIRRILPALVLVLGSSLAAGFFILGPDDLMQLARAAAAVMFMSGNFFFWRERNYFADQAPPHALLHTWSIGVEEQFYLAFPLFVRAMRHDPDGLRRWLWMGFAASLALSVWLTQSHPVASFYLLPTRAWEFLLGGITAISARKAPRGWLAEFTAAAAAAALLISALAFSGTTPYPGIAAMLPVLGTALLLWSGSTRATVVSRSLSLKGFTVIGRVSYSAYLWHWPIFTFARHVLGQDLTAAEIGAALGVTALLSQLSWRYVEQPFRRRVGSAPIRMHWVLFSGVGLLTLAGTTLLARGFPARIAPQIYAFEHGGQPEAQPRNACHWGVGDFTDQREFCELAKYDGARIMLWGDSHANAIAPAARRLANDGHFHLWQASLSSCPPLLGVDVAHVPRNHRCREFNAQVLDAIRRLHVQRVILAAYWSNYVPPLADTAVARWFDLYSPPGSLGSGADADNQRIFDAALNQTVRSLQALGVETWVVGQVPVQSEFVPELIARTALRGDNPSMVGIPLTVHRERSAFIEASVMRLGNLIHRIDPASTLCASGTCICYANGRILYSDSNHLSADGAYFLSASLQPAFH